MPSSAQTWTQQAVRATVPVSTPQRSSCCLCNMTDLQEALCASDAIWSSGRRFV